MVEINKRPIVIGIAGGSGSGKTTYSELLNAGLNDLNVKLIHTDDYFKPIKPKIIAPFSGREYDDYDHPNAIDIERLIKAIQDSLSAEEGDVVIVEGLLVLHFEQIRNLLDLKLYVDCQSDERLVRRLNRDLHEETFEEIVSEYLDVVRHGHNQFVEPTRWHADFVVNGTKITQRSVDLVRSWALNIVGQARGE